MCVCLCVSCQLNLTLMDFPLTHTLLGRQTQSPRHHFDLALYYHHIYKAWWNSAIDSVFIYLFGCRRHRQFDTMYVYIYVYKTCSENQTPAKYPTLCASKGDHRRTISPSISQTEFLRFTMKMRSKLCSTFWCALPNGIRDKWLIWSASARCLNHESQI